MKKTLKTIFSKMGIEKFTINAAIIELEINFNDSDKKAAWELYVELLTRITTQPLDDNHGDEVTALNSIFSMFDLTRNILKRYGPDCQQFSMPAIIVLNQIIRPFTAKWHKKKIENAFENPDECIKFREELKILQKELVAYMIILADIAEVEDLSEMEISE